MRTVSHGAGTGKVGWLDACTNIPLVHITSMVMKIKRSVQWLLKEGKSEQCFQVTFSKNSQQNPP